MDDRGGEPLRRQRPADGIPRAWGTIAGCRPITTRSCTNGCWHSVSRDGGRGRGNAPSCALWKQVRFRWTRIKEQEDSHIKENHHEAFGPDAFPRKSIKRPTTSNSSIAFDSRMAQEDIAGSMAHAAMLEKQGIITPEDGRAIREGLAAIAGDLREGRLSIDPAAEDIHTFVEGELTARIGDAGKRLHTGQQPQRPGGPGPAALSQGRGASACGGSSSI